MSGIASDQVGWNILRSLGIDTTNAKKATIYIKANDVVSVEILYLATNENGFVLNDTMTDIETVLKRYELKEIKDETKKVGDNQ